MEVDTKKNNYLFIIVFKFSFLRMVLFAIWLVCAPLMWAVSRASCCVGPVHEAPASPPPTPSGEVESNYADPVYPSTQVFFCNFYSDSYVQYFDLYISI